jgi:hypothetical protein
MSADYDLKPYRIEWQFDRTVTWTPVTSCEEHDAALKVAERHAAQYGGFCRVISQHVIYRVPDGAKPATA